VPLPGGRDKDVRVNEFTLNFQIKRAAPPVDTKAAPPAKSAPVPAAKGA
jgi:hypothetical protein